MRLAVFSLIFFIAQYTEAQHSYTDSLYSVEKVKTEIYAEKNSEQLIIDLYQPDNLNKKRPLLVFMHGGGFAGGSPKNPQEVKFAQIAASRGYTVALISYRLTRKNASFGCDFEASGKMETFQLAAEDFMDAVKYLQKHADILNIDPETIIVGGSSAGAEAVLNAVYNPDLIFEDREKYAGIKFSAVISLAGALVDSRYLTKKQALPGIFFHGTDDKLVPYASAAHHYCDDTDPGYMILDGSKSVVDKLEKLEASYLFYSFQGAGHEISGIPFEYLPAVFEFLQKTVFEKNKIQTRIYQ